MKVSPAVYVEFIGLPGGGKTTIMRALERRLAQRGKRALIADEVQLGRSYGRLSSLLSLVLFPLTTLSCTVFWFMHKAVFYNSDIGTAKLRTNIQRTSLKRLLRDQLIFRKYAFDAYLCEGVLHPISFFNHTVELHDVGKITSLLPHARRVLVFVDTAPEEAFVRMRSREKRTNIDSIIEKQGDDWGRAYYANTHANIKRIFTYLSDHAGLFGFDVAVAVRGNRPADENAEAIDRALVRASRMSRAGHRVRWRAVGKTLGLSLLAVLFPLKKRGVRVLMYHSVERSEWKYSVTPEAFERQLQLVRKTVVPLSDVVAYVRGEKKLQEGSVAITIDDGYLDTYETVFPLLKKYNVPATVFVTTALESMPALGGLARPTERQLQEMHDSRLVTLEAHGHTHADLTALAASEEQFIEETKGCADILERITGRRPRFFAYAAGHRNERVAHKLEALGFEAAFSITEGTLRRGDPLFALRRVQIDGTMSLLLAALRIRGPIDTYHRIVHSFRRLSL